MAEVVRPLDPRDIVAPLLPSLPVAAIASQPASGVLPLLSPILRQRVQFLSASSSEPWIRLLSYDPAKAAKLAEIARSARLEPHPVSGEIEIDWDSSTGDHVETRYKRLDVETLQALVLLRDLDLVFRLVHCAGDEQGAGPAGGSSGWRVGEVSVPDVPDAFASFGGHATVAEAEGAFSAVAAPPLAAGTANPTNSIPAFGSSTTDNNDINDDDDDDDDDYWARYDATPARTPAVKRSPAPPSIRQATHNEDSSSHAGHDRSSQPPHAESEDAYFAQYDTVQPAMDSHDPDEVVDGEEGQSGLTGGVTAGLIRSYNLGQQAASAAAASSGAVAPAPEHAVVDDEYEVDHERLANLVHPRPASASSHGSSSLGGAGGSGGSAVIVSKLEASAGRQEQSEFGVKQHVSRSIKSLYMLARASGIDRDEFEQLVKTELDMLSMLEE
ncbi:hypothetical protein SPBR_03500 [Sporothrix brasiliensis 5110]|uniref:Uncharacterized protein n=1 Tax=Sporothrix brasiliensis 5110 TaxID=1398154 RepID=A0A0C2JDS4_9PEZI|nr:uncharacterized protein SPBR_03500 [Sporothrix brasiliensis 5110]KIH95082.1 hypothetical protein SPBR_03500 [Sporothrix brasiliensis 5110]